MEISNIKLCKQCGKEYLGRGKSFCSQTCNGFYQNSIRFKPSIKTKSCLFCGDETRNYKFCSNQCHKKYDQKKIFNLIESGDTSLDFRQYKKFLINKYGEKCMICNWGESNPYSNKVPIEIEHIDGNSDNNSLENLKLLCPNCHSLTPTYKAMNKGNGRYKRRERYKENKSY